MASLAIRVHSWSTATPSRRRNASRSLVTMLFGSNCRAAVATESRSRRERLVAPHLRRRMAEAQSTASLTRPSSSSRVLTVASTNWTYAAFDGLTDRVAGRLHSLGVSPGMRVHLAPANSPAFVAVWLAAIGMVLGSCHRTRWHAPRTP